jgi:uncharacterized protein (DUF2384 family)
MLAGLRMEGIERTQRGIMISPETHILALAAEMTGSNERAAFWFMHQPIPGWGKKTACDLVDEGKAEEALAYLEAVRSGVYA